MLRVNDALDLRQVDKSSTRVIRRDLLHVVQLVFNGQVNSLMEEYRTRLLGQVFVIGERSCVVVTRIGRDIGRKSVALNYEE